jgi:hypothetical protein
MQIYAAYHRPFYKKAPQSKSFIGFVSIIFLFLFLLALIKLFHSPQIISPISASAATKKHVPATTTQLKAKNPGELKLAIMEALDDSIPEYSIMVEDFLHPFELSMGNSSTYAGASVHKIPILITIYSAIEKGTLSLDQKVTFEESFRQDYATGWASACVPVVGATGAASTSFT